MSVLLSESSLAGDSRLARRRNELDESFLAGPFDADDAKIRGPAESGESLITFSLGIADDSFPGLDELTECEVPAGDVLMAVAIEVATVGLVFSLDASANDSVDLDGKCA